MLSDDRLKKIMYVGQRRGELHREAVRQAHAEGQLHGRKEERARIRALVQGLLTEMINRYYKDGIPESQYDDGVTTGLSKALDLIDGEDTSHE